jgi:ribosomal protein S18 acetylase RimI-like enzyme
MAPRSLPVPTPPGTGALPAGLRSAARLVIRPLVPRDLPAVEAHFLELELVDRCQRFHACKSDAALAAYVAGLDLERVILIGAFDPMSGALVGLAEAHLDDARRPTAAELSASVLAPWRDAGLGRRLVRQALEVAFRCGADTARFEVAPDNRPMRRLLQALGAQLDPRRGAAVIGSGLPLAA